MKRISCLALVTVVLGCGSTSHVDDGGAGKSGTAGSGSGGAHAGTSGGGAGAAGTGGEGAGGAAGSSAAGATGTGGGPTTGAAGAAGGSAGVGGAAGQGGSMGTAGVDAGAAGAGGQGGAHNCGPADILIVLKASGSMENDVNNQPCAGGCGSNSKWTQLTSSLTTLTGQTQSTVAWGLKVAASATSGCTLSAGVEVSAAPNNATAIMSAIAAASPAGSSPIRAAMQAGVSYLQKLSDANPKYLLLASDGQAGCLSGGAGDVDIGVAVSAAAAAGFPTFILGIDNSTAGATTLNSAAISGGVPQTGAATSFYRVNDTAQLEAAIAKSVGSSATCQH